MLLETYLLNFIFDLFFELSLYLVRHIQTLIRVYMYEYMYFTRDTKVKKRSNTTGINYSALGGTKSYKFSSRD